MGNCEPTWKCIQNRTNINISCDLCSEGIHPVPQEQLNIPNYLMAFLNRSCSVSRALTLSKLVDYIGRIGNNDDLIIFIIIDDVRINNNLKVYRVASMRCSSCIA